MRFIPIPWCHEISYLGLVLVACRKLNYSFHIKKAKYFGLVNSVLGKIGTCKNAGLVLSQNFLHKLSLTEDSPASLLFNLLLKTT